MAKFHINDKGEPGACSAAQGNCPFGGEAAHYGSQSDARNAYEMSQSVEAATAPNFSKKKLSALGVDDALADKILASGFTLNGEGLKMELEKLPIYPAGKPEVNDRIKVVRRTYDGEGNLKMTEHYVGKFVDIAGEDGGEGRSEPTGNGAIVTDDMPLSEDAVEHRSAKELNILKMTAHGNWTRLRTNGPITFGSNHGDYTEHDTIERTGPEDASIDEQNEIVRARNEEIVEAKYREEARARRPWPFNRN